MSKYVYPYAYDAYGVILKRKEFENVMTVMMTTGKMIVVCDRD